MTDTTTATPVLTRTLLANLLALVIVAFAVTGLLLLGAEVGIAILAGLVVFIAIKADDRRIRKSREI